MSSSIRMNQIINMDEDPELFEFLKKFSKGKPYQARKLMLLGLVQLGRLNGGEVEVQRPASPVQSGNNTQQSEYDLIGNAGLDELFDS